MVETPLTAVVFILTKFYPILGITKLTYREFDNINFVHSINRCDTIKVPSYKTLLTLATPTPGCMNDCPGWPFLLENHLSSVALDQKHQRHDVACSSNYTKNSYYKIRPKDIVHLKARFKAATGRSESESGRIVVSHSIAKRPCIRHANNRGTTTNNQKNIVPVI